MSTPTRQSKLSFGRKGNVQIDHHSDQSSRSPSPVSNARRAAQQIRHSFNNHTADHQDGARSEGEGLSDEDDDVELGAGRATLLDFEADESSDEGDADQPGGKRRKRYSEEETEDGEDEGEEEEEVEIVVSSAKKGKDKGKGKKKEIVVQGSSDDEPEQPVASTSKYTSRQRTYPSKSTTSLPSPKPKLQRNSRSHSVFEGVIIDLPSPKKRKVSRSAPKPAAPANQAILEVSSDHSEDVRPSQRTAKAKGKASSSKAKPKLSPPPASKSKKRSRSHRTPSSPSASSSSDSDSLPVPASLKKQSQARKRARTQADRRNKLERLTQGVKHRRSDDEESDKAYIVDDDAEIVFDTDVEDELAELDGKERKKRRRELAKVDKEKERKKRAQANGGVPSSSSGTGSSSDGDSSEDLPAPSKLKTKASKKARIVSSEDEVEVVSKPKPKSQDKGQGKETSKDKAAAVAAEKKAKADRYAAELLASDDAEGETSSSRRKKTAGKLKKKKKRQEEEPDDLEILDEQTVFDERFRSQKDAGAKFAALRAAREKRAGAQKKTLILESDDEATSDTHSRSHSTRPAPAQTSASTSTKLARNGPKYMGAPSSSSEEESSSDDDSSGGSSDSSNGTESFIVDEEDVEAKKIVDAFLEETRGNAQGLKYHLKTYLLWVIHDIVCPDVNWLSKSQPEFRDAQSRVHSTIDGMLNSLIGSSAWKPAFQKAIDSRPVMNVDELGKGERGAPCDACTMGNSRHSVYIATLSGRKYNRKTLRYVTYSDDSSDSDSSSDDSSDEETGKGRVKGKKKEKKEPKYPKEKNYEFNLGKHCAARGLVYTQLRHWAWETKQRMIDKMADERRPVPKAKITEGMSKAEREEARKKVVQWQSEEAQRIGEVLDKRKVMDSFAQRLDKEIQDARETFTRKGK